MKEVQSLFTFVLAALCFAAFVTLFKPAAIAAVPTPSEREHCETKALPGLGCAPSVFAAASGDVVRLRQ